MKLSTTSKTAIMFFLMPLHHNTRFVTVLLLHLILSKLMWRALLDFHIYVHKRFTYYKYLYSIICSFLNLILQFFLGNSQIVYPLLFSTAVAALTLVICNHDLLFCYVCLKPVLCCAANSQQLCKLFKCCLQTD